MNAATKTRKRTAYTIAAAGDLAAKTITDRKKAIEQAEERAAKYGVNVTVTRQDGTEAHVALAPLPVTEAETYREMAMDTLYALFLMEDKHAVAEWARRQRHYAKHLSKGKNAVPGPLMVVFLLTGARRENRSLMAGVDGRSRGALVRRGWATAKYDDKGKMVGCAVNESGIAAIWQ